MVYSPRILSFVALTAIAVITQLAFKLSQNSNGGYDYNTKSAMTVVEFMKLLMSASLLWRTNFPDEALSTVVQSFRQTFERVPRQLYRNYFYLALSYGVYNQLIFALMESSIDVGTFSLLKSSTPAIVSCINWWVLGQQLTSQQTLCMIVQCFGIIPVIMSTSNSEKAQLEFRVEDIMLALYCCCMASLNTVFNAVVIKSDDTSIHVQNIVLYAYGVIVNLLLYLTITSTQSNFLYGFGQPWVIFLMVLNSFVGLAITMIYKYGDAVLKTLTQPFASSVLVLLAYFLFDHSLDVVKAAGAGVVIVDTILYLRLNSAPVPDELTKTTESELSLSRRKRCLILAILFFSMFGVTNMTVFNASMRLLTGTSTRKTGNLRLVTHRNDSISDAHHEPVPIVLVIQSLRLNNIMSANNETEKQMMIDENDSKINVFENYRSSFIDLYYESPQYVGRRDLDVSCGDLAFRNIRNKCYSCVDRERYYFDNYRYACAAELFSFAAMAAPRNDTIKGYLVIHADFYITPGFVEEARGVLLHHPLSIWTIGDRRDSRNWSAITPSHYTSDPAPDPPPEVNPWWWKTQGPLLDAARASAAQLFPSLVLNPGDKLVPRATQPGSWVDLYFVPASISDRFGVFARLLKKFRVLNEIAVVEVLYLAGIDGRIDGEYKLPCYGGCCEKINATLLANHTFLDRYPCGHKIDLHDAGSRSAIAAAWVSKSDDAK
jgi:drug/metabolite transporter (DMT)-like permease